MQGIKTYFVVDSLSLLRGFVNEDGHSMFLEWHAVPTDDADPTGKQLVVARFANEIFEERWVSTPGVSPLPHPMNSGGKIDADKHHAHLQKKFGTTPNDTVWDVAAKAGKISPIFKLTAFW